MRTFLLISLILLGIHGFSQVGIGTDAPTKDLDINGELRIRTINNGDVPTDGVILTDANGVVKKTTPSNLINNTLKTVVKGSFAQDAGSLVSLSLLSSEAKITFNAEEIDLNDEYDVTSATYTAKQPGIYRVYSQIKAGGTVAVATNFGISIRKNGTIIARNNFANIGITVVITEINVTPPVRSAENLIQLNTGDTIEFYFDANLLSVDLIKNKVDSYFTIEQIR